MNSPREKILGQLLVLKLQDTRWSTRLERLLEASAPGGILLAGELPRSPETVAGLLRNIAEALPVTPFFAIEEEGGEADPLSAFLPPLPAARTVAQEGDSAAARLGEFMGEALKLLGFNTNLAPVLDLATPLSEKVLGSRSFGSDPQQVVQRAAAFIRGLRRHRILACGKHFPGLGSVREQAPLELPNSPKSMAGLWREDLVPYRHLLPQLPFVMLSQAVYRAHDFDYPRPAVLSESVIGGLLRTKLGYGGLVVAQGLESGTVRGKLDLTDAIAQCIEAGCDLLVTESEDSLEVMQQALAWSLESGRLSEERLRQSLLRIRAAKKGLARPGSRIPKRRWDRLAKGFAALKSGSEAVKSA